ncbi:MAG: hypothetical protein K2K57_04395 [Oscillospiraceae bacterium]|nr:hypothetical protein [Oscillospiraceae bacterium]
MAVASFLILIASIVYFSMDRAEKLDRRGIGRVIGYIAMPIASALAVCVNVIAKSGGLHTFFTTDYITSDEYLLSNFTIDGAFVAEVVICLLASLTVIIISAVGCAAIAAYERESAKQSFGTYDLETADRLLRMASFAAIGGLAAAAASIVFGTVSIVYAVGALTVNLGALIITFILLTLFTLGMGLILAIVAIPVYTVVVGIRVIAELLPMLASMVIWGGAFCLLHLFAVLFGEFAVKRLSAAGILQGRNTVLYGILCAMPLVNVVCIFLLRSKIKAAAMA